MTPWTVAHQAPLSWNSPDKNTGVCCHFLFPGTFPTQGSNPGLIHCRWILYCLSHQGSSVLILHTFIINITYPGWVSVRSQNFYIRADWLKAANVSKKPFKKHFKCIGSKILSFKINSKNQMLGLLLWWGTWLYFLCKKKYCNILIYGISFACGAGDLGLIPGLGRSPGEGNGNPLQYSYLENSTDWGAW